MKALIYLLGILFVISGICLLIEPKLIIDLLVENKNQSWLYYSAIIGRLIIGIILYKASSISTFPKIFRAIGILSILAAILFLAIGKRNFTNLLDQLSSSVAQLSPVAGIVAIFLGGFLVYAIKRDDLSLK